MKIGFTDRNRNIYELKKKNSIGFGQSNTISQKTTVVQKDGDDKKKTDKNKNIAKIALAVTVPTAAIALAAFAITKGKKKNIDTSKIAPKIEKEITKNDLLKDSKEITKILKVFSSLKTGSNLSLESLKNARRILDGYDIKLRDMFGENNPIQQKLAPIINQIIKHEEHEMSLVVDEPFKKIVKDALAEITNFIKILQKYDDINAIKNAIENMTQTKKTRANKKNTAPRPNALVVENEPDKSYVINFEQNFKYEDFAKKDVKNPKFIQDKNKQSYLVFDAISENIQDKNKSGFIIDGMGDTRFFAVKLDGISPENLVKMLQNGEVMKEFDSEGASQDAQAFLFATMNNLTTGKEIFGVVGNNEVLAKSDVMKKYVEQKINITKENKETVIQDIIANKDEKLTWVLSSEKKAQEFLSEIITSVSVDSEEGFDVEKKEKGKEKETLIQNLAQNIEQSHFKDKYQNVVTQLKRISAVRALKTSKPKDLMQKYHELLELFKEELSNIDGCMSLLVFNDGRVGTIQDGTISLDSNAMYRIQTQDNTTNIYDLSDVQVIYKEGRRLSDTELEQKLKFNFDYFYLQGQIKDIVDLKDIFDVNIMLKPLIYEFKEALNVLPESNLSEDQKGILRNAKNIVNSIWNMQNSSSKSSNDENEMNNLINNLLDLNLNSLSFSGEYDKAALDVLINQTQIIDKGTWDDFVNIFASKKMCVGLPVYKQLVGLGGALRDKDGKEIGFRLEEIKPEQEIIENNKKIKVCNYTYKLSNGTKFKIQKTDNNKNNKKCDEVFCRILQKEELQKEKCIFKTQEGKNDYFNKVAQNNISGTLLFYSFDEAEKEAYFKQKLADLLKYANWANKAQDIIHSMYSFGLLSNGTRRNSAGSVETITSNAAGVYKEYLEGAKNKKLYITLDGTVLANPKNEDKIKLYELALG